METKEKKVFMVELRGNPIHIFFMAKMPRGIALLATIVHRLGYNVTCFVESLLGFNWKKLLEGDVVCFSMITCTAGRTYKAVNKLLRWGYKGMLIAGGPHASACPEETLNAGFDVVVRHEGEKPIPAVLSVVTLNRSMWDKRLANIPGISWVDRYGQVRHNPDRAFLTSAELSSLPCIDFKLIPGYENMSTIPIETSRGCPNCCNFCAVSGQFGIKYRYLSVEAVLDQLRNIRNNYYETLWLKKRFFFHADNIVGDEKGREIIEEICFRMINEDLIPPKKWLFQMFVVDARKYPDLCRLISDAGGDTACLGLETDNPETLLDMNKPQSPEDIMAGLENLRKAGIKTLGMMITGTDQDTFSGVRNSVIRMRKRGKITFLMMSAMTLLPGTKLTRKFIKSGRKFSRDPKNQDGLHITHRPPRMSRVALWVSLWDSMGWFYFRTLHGWNLIIPHRKVVFKLAGLAVQRVITAPWRFLRERLSG